MKNVEKCRKQHLRGVFQRCFFDFRLFRFRIRIHREEEVFLDPGRFCTKINNFYVKYTLGYQYPVNYCLGMVYVYHRSQGGLTQVLGIQMVSQSGIRGVDPGIK